MVVAIAETDMLKADISFGCREDHRVCCIRHFFLFVQQLKYPFRCGDSALQGVYRVGNLCNRLRSLIDILDKRLNITNRDSSPDDGHSPANRYCHIAELTYQTDDRADHVIHEHGLFAGAEQVFVEHLGVIHRCLFQIKCLAYKVPGEILLNAAVQPPEGL